MIASKRDLTLEITTRCNLACAMCPHGLPNGVSNKRDAPDVLIDSVLSVVDEYDVIRPTGLGEPLMAPGFWRIVDTLAENRSARLAFVTNGVLLTKTNVARLIKAPLASINVSVDAANEATHFRIRGNTLERTLNGVKRLVAAISDLPEPERTVPQVKMSMVLMRENIEEAADFVRLAHATGVRRVYFEHLIDPFMDAKQWNVQRGNFHFNYAEQRLFSTPDFADEQIIRAMDVADELGVKIGGPEILLSTHNLHHNERPCRAESLAMHRSGEAEWFS